MSRAASAGAVCRDSYVCLSLFSRYLCLFAFLSVLLKQVLVVVFFVCVVWVVFFFFSNAALKFVKD